MRGSFWYRYIVRDSASFKEMTISEVRINDKVQPWSQGQIVHIQRQACSLCRNRMGGIAIDLDYVEKGDELIGYIVGILTKYKVRSICENCVTKTIKNQLKDTDIVDLK